ncbi:MAG: anaerobic ribonucleoside-triphosphate reductase activating protein [Oscillospiraceae bacterium]|nr:anaerobic ribonucleoside-triphosphate reductase activating protein [Oscillospiraceae bacterium]
MLLQVSGTANDSIVDGPGLRFTVFVQGCPHRCPGCHNPQTHPFEGGTPTETGALLERIKENPLLDGVTFSGGEPFCQAPALAALGQEVRRLGLNIMTYTGYTFEDLYEHLDEEENGYRALLSVTDWLVDGPFIESLKSYQLHFKGSINQRILDVQKSLAAGSPVGADWAR